MTRFSLILRNIVYHARTNLAVLLGCAVGAAVLTGALLVGDSLRGSLRERIERQLRGTDVILVGQRFFRAELADYLPGKVTPLILMQGSLRGGQGDREHRIGKVTVLGVDSRFGVAVPPNPTSDPQFNTSIPVVLSNPLAKELEAKVGDALVLGLAKASAVPKSSFLGSRSTENSTYSPKLIVSGILPPDDSANDFSLSPSPATPFNLFISLDRLQAEIKQDGRVNVLLASGEPVESLQSALAKNLQASDWDLKIHIPPERKSYISVESRRMFLEPYIAAAAEATAQKLQLRYAPTLVYLATSISDGKNFIPYSVIAALEPAQPAPLGPFLPAGVSELKHGEIVLVDWKESPLRVQPGEKISVKYYKPEIEDRIGEDDELEELTAEFKLAGTIPLEGVAKDRNLTPEFPGITDQKEIGNWQTPFTVPKGRIKPRDERYWSQFATTPKAYIRLDDGQELWKNRFGNLTSIRIAAPEKGELETTRNQFTRELEQVLNREPSQGGFVFQPIRQRLMNAGEGSTDFGMLFLAFSFFLIVAALMLVGLLFRLNLDRRAGEVGLLRATGYRLSTVRWMLLGEGVLLAAIGSGIGLIAASLYADAMLKLLVALWPSENVGSFLHLHVSAMSLAIGFASSVAMSAIAVWWALRILSRSEPAKLLKGDLSPDEDPTKIPRPSRRSLWIAGISLFGAIAFAVMGPFMPPGEPQAGTFFSSGGCLLIAGLAYAWWWLKRPDVRLLKEAGNPGMNHLGNRNARRNPTRSLLTVGLLASASFLIVAVESFRRQPDRDFLQDDGGSGGFPLVAESTTPILFDPNDEGGKGQIDQAIQKWVQDNLPREERAERLKYIESMLEGIQFYRFRLQGGDDASCLNLYQATRPRLLGVPANLIQRGGFQFSDSLAMTPEEKKNPWLLLHWQPGEEAIPVFVEQNTAIWMLKKGLGDTFEVPDQYGKPLKLRIAGLLLDSVFQSEVLVPESVFRESFSNIEGYSYFLIKTHSDPKEVARWLTVGLSNYGFEATLSRNKLASYLAVQNTYLTTFQLLGGFGLMLGILGLAVVLLRSVWERQAELALLQCLGYRHRNLNRIFFFETVILLNIGLLIGVLAALLSVLPHLAGGGQVPWFRLGVMLAVVFVAGMVIAYVAVGMTLRKSLIPALREE
jgi:ABC-type lipoprotein release transport system permease subunit